MNIIITLIIICAPIISAQENQKPCSSPKAKEFNFWVGDWHAEWVDADGKKATGFNSVKAIWDGCAIEENFNGTPGTQLLGKSYSVYNPGKNKWYQTWVDNFGGYLTFEGEFINNSMILSTERTEQDGKKVLMRMVWKDIEKNKFTWHWERSADGGNTWEPKWIIYYTRK